MDPAHRAVDHLVDVLGDVEDVEGGPGDKEDQGDGYEHPVRVGGGGLIRQAVLPRPIDFNENSGYARSQQLFQSIN